MTTMSDSEALDHMRTEAARLRRDLRNLTASIDPQLGYSGRWITDMLNKILTGSYE